MRDRPVIFVTVGSMFPFDRLVGAVDAWAAARVPPPDVLAQIGEGRPPRHLRWERRLDPAAWEAAVAAATLVVAHAGVGAAIAAATHGKPLVILPRLRRLGEHVSDHQLETAGWLAARPGVRLAADETALGAVLDAALAAPQEAPPRASPRADPLLVARLRAFILKGGPE